MLLRASSDQITQLYVNELRGYKASGVVESPGLQESFKMPVPPQQPAVEGLDFKEPDAKMLEEAQWPALKDPIDDPENYNGFIMCLFM